MPLRRPRIVCKPRRKVKANRGPHGGYWISDRDINVEESPVRNCFRAADIRPFNRTHNLAEADGLPAAPPLLALGVPHAGTLSLVSGG